jgi:hypothetical protein
LLLISRIRKDEEEKEVHTTHTELKIKELINHEDLLDLDNSAVALIEGH